MSDPAWHSGFRAGDGWLPGRAARAAALADEGGSAFDQQLVAHGAEPRPPREQTVRWYKRRPADRPAT